MIEDIDYQHPRGLDRKLLRTLSAREWVRQNQNVLFIGPTGIGKSWLACALAQKACRDGFSVLHKRTTELFRELAVAHVDGSIKFNGYGTEHARGFSVCFTEHQADSPGKPYTRILSSGVDWLAKETSVAVLAVRAVGPLGNPTSQNMTHLAANAFLLRHIMPQIIRPKASQTLGQRIKCSQWF